MQDFQSPLHLLVFKFAKISEIVKFVYSYDQLNINQPYKLNVN